MHRNVQVLFILISNADLFVRKVYSFEDIDALESENAIKEAGKLRSEGKDYIMQDGDVVHFRFNV